MLFKDTSRREKITRIPQHVGNVVETTMKQRRKLKIQYDDDDEDDDDADASDANADDEEEYVIWRS